MDAESLLTQLERVLGEIDAVLKAVVSGADERTSAAKERLQETLGEAREQLGEVERRLIGELRDGWKSTDRYVRENAWVVVGAAAVFGFFAGVAVSRRR